LLASKHAHQRLAHLQETLLQCISDANVDASEALAAKEGQGAGTALSEEERCDVLVLRGLLACGILEHSLQMRHLVDYGVNRWD
jgi:hypothetical protein